MSTHRQHTTVNSTAVGIAIFIITAIAAITISLFQRNRGLLAPTAPQSLPSAAVIQSNTCTLSIDIASEANFQCLKKAYEDEFDNAPGNYHLRKNIQTIRAGEVIVWAIDVINSSADSIELSLSDVMNDLGMEHVTFMDSNCGDSAFNSTSKTLTCDLGSVEASGLSRVILRVRVNNNAPLDAQIKNIAAVTDGDGSEYCQAQVIVDEETTQLLCNAPCETDKECSKDDNLVCHDTGEGSFCRNAACVENPDCVCNGASPVPTSTVAQASNTPRPTDSISPSDTPVPTNTPGTGGPTATPTVRPSNTPVPTASPTLPPGVTPSITPTPTPGPSATPTPLSSCNQPCARNADCADINHICVDSSNGRVCRLATNPGNSSCSTATPSNTPVPPSLPGAGGTGSLFVVVTAVLALLVLGSLALLLIL